MDCHRRSSSTDAPAPPPADAPASPPADAPSPSDAPAHAHRRAIVARFAAMGIHVHVDADVPDEVTHPKQYHNNK